jgi:hypothetical protein
MNERERLERTRQLLELLDTHHANRRELERRAARSEVLKLPLPLGNDLEEVRERIAETEGELRALEAADPSEAVTRRAIEARLRHAQAEIGHLQDLLRKRRANAGELARREAGHGPGQAPLELTNRLKAEQEAVEELEDRLCQAEAALEALREKQAEAEPEREDDEAEASSSLRLFIATPDGARYETEAPADTLVVRLQSAFLADWQPPEDAGAVRYTLQRDPDEQDLSPALTLEEAGLEDGETLHLVPEPLPSDAPVGLTVEDAEGNRYVTRVRLDTSIEALGMAFMEMVKGSGPAVVEVARGAGGYRRLRYDATLYDERVGEGSRLRIRTAA